MRWCALDDWKKIHVVRCGLDPNYWLDAVQGYGESFVCVGRLCEQKGQLLLIDALAALRERGKSVSLVLAGDGDMRPEIEERIRQLGLTSQVEITGWIGETEVRRRLLNSKAMVLPSFAEGLPVVIMEALALRRPVISTFVAGIPELVEDGISGWLVPAGSLEHLVDAMDAASDASRHEVDLLGSAGRRAVVDRHDVNREAARLAELFQQAIAGPRESIGQDLPGSESRFTASARSEQTELCTVGESNQPPESMLEEVGTDRHA
jgi:glycosyltransferase involved in cell wall biosynthesis